MTHKNGDLSSRDANDSNRCIKRAIALAIVSLLSLPASTFAADGPVSATELMAILKNAKVVAPADLLRAALTEQEALVSAKRNPKDSDNDCKINAVLFAKSLMDAYPSQVLRVKVLLFDFEKSKYNQIVIRKGDVAAFQSGSLSKDALLSSIEITNVADPGMGGGNAQSSGAAGVVAGPFQDKRLLLLSHIEALNQKGTNVKAFRAIFDQIEDMARQGNEAALNQKIPYLLEKLQEQQKLVKQASQVGRTSGTVSHVGSGSQPAPAPAAAGPGGPSGADQLMASKLISRRLFLEGAINHSPEDKRPPLKQRAAHIDHLIEGHQWRDADKEITAMERELDVKHPFDFH